MRSVSYTHLDSHFSGNVSGLAMEYKLLGFEQKIKIKERFFVKGLEKRIELISRLLEQMCIRDRR